MTFILLIKLFVAYKKSLVTLSWSHNHHFHWMVHKVYSHVTRNGVSLDLPHHDIPVPVKVGWGK